jgi:TonB family protein
MPSRSSFLLAAALTACAAPAAAGDTPARVLQGPPGAVIHAAAVSHGKMRLEPGRAVAHCRVSAAGAVSGCQLVRETPAGAALGDVLLAVAAKYRVAPATRDGAPVDSEILLELDTYRDDKPAGWLRKPTANDLLTVYPTAAYQRGLSGEATISCLVSTQGALFDCYVVNESPAGEKFGYAALALTPQFLMRPASLNGQAVVSSVRIPVNFRTFGAGSPLAATRKSVPPAFIWAAAPSYADVAAAYPEKAKAAKVGGHATVYCEFKDTGGLTECRTVAEEPRGQGFGAAAAKLARQFRLPVAGPDDVKALRTAAVQLPVTFDPAMTENGPQVLGKPPWAATPSADDVAAAFAGTPRNVGTVRVMLACKVEQGGWTSGCTVDSETPSGRGFGKAALALAPKFRLATWTDEGLPVVGGVVHVPLRYESGAPAPASAPGTP